MAQAGIAYRDMSLGAPQRVSPRKTRELRRNTRILRVFIGLVMAALFVYISRLAVIADNTKKINSLSRDIRQMEEQRQYLEITLSARQNLDRVRDEATQRLGMIYPQEVYMVSLSSYAADANTQTVYDAQAMP